MLGRIGSHEGRQKTFDVGKLLRRHARSRDKLRNRFFKLEMTLSQLAELMGELQKVLLEPVVLGVGGQNLRRINLLGRGERVSCLCRN